jgi:hypothetical protein
MGQLKFRTFDEYWNSQSNPAADQAWKICAEEREAVMRDQQTIINFQKAKIERLTQILIAILNTVEPITDSLPIQGKRVPIQTLRQNWKLYEKKNPPT